MLTGNLNTARAQHTATLLPNGKVLVAGGTNNSGYLTKRRTRATQPPGAGVQLAISTPCAQTHGDVAVQR